MDGLSSQLDMALTLNERHHSLWCQYDTEHSAFANWMASQSSELQTEPLKAASLEDKKTGLDIQQVGMSFWFAACRFFLCTNAF